MTPHPYAILVAYLGVEPSSSESESEVQTVIPIPINVMTKNEGYKFAPDENNVYKQGYSTEKDFIFTTTQFITMELLNKIHAELKENESLLICTTQYEEMCIDKFDNITIKKIPQSILNNCEYGRDDYSLNVEEVLEVKEDE